MLNNAEEDFDEIMVAIINGAMYVIPMAIIAGCIVCCVKGCNKSQKAKQGVQEVSVHQRPDINRKNTFVLSKAQWDNRIKSR